MLARQIKKEGKSLKLCRAVYYILGVYHLLPSSEHLYMHELEAHCYSYWLLVFFTKSTIEYEVQWKSVRICISSFATRNILFSLPTRSRQSPPWFGANQQVRLYEPCTSRHLSIWTLHLSASVAHPHLHACSMALAQLVWNRCAR